MKIIEKKIVDLKAAEYNPRKLSDKQKDDLKISLEKFGCQEPVIINTFKGRENVIIGGHQRTKVWAELGFKTIPCVEVQLTLEDEKELNIRLNKNGGEFDYELLNEYFEKDDLIEFGFNDVELTEYDEVNMNHENFDIIENNDDSINWNCKLIINDKNEFEKIHDLFSINDKKEIKASYIIQLFQEK